MARIDNAISKKVYELMNEIEKLPASEQQTKVITIASEIIESLEPLNELKKIL